jgi:dihydroorotate dehydrogenase electron transfer subunit
VSDEAPRTHVTTVSSLEEVAQEMFRLRLDAPELAQASKAGQFVMVQVTTSRTRSVPTYFLRRPIALHGIDREGGGVSLLFQVHGGGTRLLSSYATGTLVDVLGPLGKPVALPESKANVVFVAGGLGIASVTSLFDVGVEREWRMTLLAGARNAWRLYPSRLLPPEVVEKTATDDGSAGVRSPVTHLLIDAQDGVDQVIACGPTPMLRVLARMRSEGTLTAPTMVLLESRMGCGFGICQGCAVATDDGPQLICAQGPGFDLNEIQWDDPVLAPTL